MTRKEELVEETASWEKERPEQLALLQSKNEALAVLHNEVHALSEYIQGEDSLQVQALAELAAIDAAELAALPKVPLNYTEWVPKFMEEKKTVFGGLSTSYITQSAFAAGCTFIGQKGEQIRDDQRVEAVSKFIRTIMVIAGTAHKVDGKAAHYAWGLKHQIPTMDSRQLPLPSVGVKTKAPIVYEKGTDLKIGDEEEYAVVETGLVQDILSGKYQGDLIDGQRYPARGELKFECQRRCKDAKLSFKYRKDKFTNRMEWECRAEGLFDAYVQERGPKKNVDAEVYYVRKGFAGPPGTFRRPPEIHPEAGRTRRRSDVIAEQENPLH
jgi:hypothetical protein